MSLAAIVVLAKYGRRRRGRHKLRLCRSCAYDLTGNVSGVCPECGTAIAKPTAEFSD